MRLPSAHDAPFEALPAELREALLAEAALYRPLPVVLENEGGLDRELPELLRVRPRDPVSPSWLGGTLSAWGDGAPPLYQGEIVHVDPGSGDLYAAVSAETSLDLTALQGARWRYEPFNFAEALTMAAQALGARASAQLERVRGEIAERAADFWAQPWALLWGPPGTGKTEEVAQRLATLIREEAKVRVLAVAPTNRAADVLAARVARLAGAEWLAAEKPCPIFRGGVGVGAELLRAHPNVVRAPELRKTVERIDALSRELVELQARRAAAQALAEKRRAIAKLRRAVPDPTLAVVQRDQTRLVVTTLHRALRLVAELGGAAPFSQLVIDEAGMVPRAAAALIAPLARTALLAGDPRQLGPVSQAVEGEGAGVRTWLRRSPLSHLADAARAEQLRHVRLLRTQHRMHPQVGDVVSRFSYAGLLEHGPATRQLRLDSPAAYPDARACWLVLEASGGTPRQCAHERGPSGRGYRRPFSAELLIEVAKAAIATGRKVLALTPYRAQAELLVTTGAREGLPSDRFTASTIHRQQGSEADVVLVDTVAGGRPFPPDELAALLNVAASRAREHLFVAASAAEAEATTAGRFLSLLQPVQASRKPALKLTPLETPPRIGALEAGTPRHLGDELEALVSGLPLFTEDQLALMERRIGDGHYLVRGVAGSGKSFVLAEWAVRHLCEHPERRVLITYFNQGLVSMLERLLRRAAEARVGGGAPLAALLSRATVIHAHQAVNEPQASFDAVFVDEAQDAEGEQLAALYRLVRGESPKPFLLFADDSQNVYGRKPLEELVDALPERLDFKGRVRVLKEAFRSTRQILDLAFNVVLDPKKRHTVGNPGMREALHLRELAAQGLLHEPQEGAQELFRVAYTERLGVAPAVRGFRGAAEEERWIAVQIARLIGGEGVKPGDILVVTPSRPQRIAQALQRSLIPAVAYGGSGGEPAAKLGATRGDHVRATTVFSCKGHESPIVFFAGLEALDDLGWLNKHKDGPARGAREEERMRRCLFYVGATRAMVRLYLTGQQDGRFVRAAAAYAEDLGARPTKRGR